MDMSKLTKADRIIAGGGLAFLVSMFFNWFSFSAGPLGDIGANGFDVNFQWGRLPLLIALGMITWIALGKFSNVKLPTEIPALFLIGGASVFLLPALELLKGEKVVSRSFGLFLAVLCGAGVAFGGYLKFLELGGKVDELKSQFAGMADQVGDKAKSAIDDAKKKD
jgi:hypothetical protein